MAEVEGTAQVQQDEHLENVDHGQQGGEEQKSKEARTYTDEEVDAIIERKLARWKKQREQEVAEAAKLAEMNATQKLEYERDLKRGIDPEIPVNYFPNDDPTREPLNTWRAQAQLLYTNWLNYYVYQTTPYDIRQAGGAQ